MKRFAFPFRHGAILAMLFGLFLASPVLLQAQAPVKMKNFKGIVDISTTPAVFALEGQASHLGRFVGKGQVVFAPGEEAGTIVGSGPVVLRAANGDLLVGNMTWTLSAAVPDNSRTTSIHFRWSDFVRFSDGTTATNTGRFVTDRPPGLVVVAKTEPSKENVVILILIAIFR